jgi:hypothetical protein
MPTFYTVNESDLSFRVLDGEAVIISASTGYYYSLNRTGTVLWHLLLEGECSAASAAESLAALYGADGAAVSRDVETLLALLVAESLIRTAPRPATAVTNGAPARAPDHPYEQPQLVKFDRLQRLMVCGE